NWRPGSLNWRPPGKVDRRSTLPGGLQLSDPGLQLLNSLEQHAYGLLILVRRIWCLLRPDNPGAKQNSEQHGKHLKDPARDLHRRPGKRDNRGFHGWLLTNPAVARISSWLRETARIITPAVEPVA